MLVAIYGANGHLGRLVAAELLAREQDIVLAGRDERALRTLADELDAPGRVRTQVAPLDDPASLRELAGSAGVLIHCAGPFAVTGGPVASAAASAGCHYVDHAIEPQHVRFMFEAMQDPARRSGIVMIPQMSCCGAIADLLAAVVAEDLPAIDRVTVGYAVTGLRMTPGMQDTADLLIREVDRVTFTEGTLRSGPVEVRTKIFPFPLPLGPRETIAPFPAGEVVTIPRHVHARTVESQLAIPADDDGETGFVVTVQAFSRAGGGRIGHVMGRDIWQAGALASVEAALELARGDSPVRPGVQSAAEAFPAARFLRTLEALGAFSLQV